MKSESSKWILYNVVVGFAVYWLSNLVLWYPWSINERFGQILMLTINPFFWGVASYSCIVRYPKPNILKGVFLSGLIFLMQAVISDVIFFAIIRNAADKLMHVTTLYAWGFVLVLPFMIFYLFRKMINDNQKKLAISSFGKPLGIGLVAFAAIVIILLFDIRFN